MPGLAEMLGLGDKEASEEDSTEGEGDIGTQAAQELIDAIKAGNADAVYSAFKGLKMACEE